MLRIDGTLIYELFHLKQHDVGMCISFILSMVGLIAILPVYFLSLEHLKLQRRYGKEKGVIIGDILGLISGWGFFLLWAGIWISPQPRFYVAFPLELSVLLPIVNLSIPMVHLMMCIPFLIPGAWIAVKAVRATTLRVAETHRTEQIVTTGIYSVVRHPQYLGGLLSHLGVSLLLSAWYSMLFTPLMLALVYLISKKEEQELAREFGNEYELYRNSVPMLIPRIKN
ncbi:MAG: isoprenylcysteine carboxylmethyltransferase family protein [Candidatus Bathyarchaeota archaeon]|nr:MAG: isoprenylcysteine carboxylmethyltransferase family protein [Candidatus Bathyarchaeota archaeon]